MDLCLIQGTVYQNAAFLICSPFMSFQVMLRNPAILTKMKIVMQANYKIFLIVEKMEVRVVYSFFQD